MTWHQRSRPLSYLGAALVWATVVTLGASLWFVFAWWLFR